MRRGQEYQLPDRQVLTSAVGRITAYMRSSIGILIFALVLAALSAVLTIVGPDQVGKIATRMADGLTTGIDLHDAVDGLLHELVVRHLEGVVLEGTNL